MKLKQVYKLPVNARTILTYIDQEGPKTQKQLYEDLNFSYRVLRYTLTRMELRGVIFKKANLEDMRSLFYVIDETIVGRNIDLFLQNEKIYCQM